MRTQRVIAAILVTGALAAGCSHPHAAEPKPAPLVKTEAVGMLPAASGVRYSASIEAFEQVPLSFKANGYIDAILRRNGADGRSRVAQPGDKVTRGTVLARIREDDYRDRVAQSKARLAEAEASQLKARLDLDRARTLFQADSLTKPELDGAQASFDAAQARVASAQADIALAQTALRDTALVAPATGVILERRIEVGALAGAGTVGFVLGNLSAVKARFGVPDAMIQSVRLGDSINVTVEAVAGETFQGRVTGIAPAADEKSRIFDIEVAIPNADDRLRPGMIGTVAIGQADAPAERPLAVPLTAVVRASAGSGQFAVLVVEKEEGRDVARMHPVELGEVSGNLIAVLKGVNPGDQVVVSGATLLVHGEPVRLFE